MGRAKVFLDDRKLRKLEKKLSEVNSKYARVGILEGAPRHKGSGMAMAELAKVHQFGSPGNGIPARDFIRAPLVTAKADQMKVSAMIVKSIIKGMSIEKGFDIIGMWGEATIKAAMSAGDIKPANAPSTIAKKGSNKPLIDTGELHDSISHKVV